MSEAQEVTMKLEGVGRSTSPLLSRMFWARCRDPDWWPQGEGYCVDNCEHS